ncbi:hypothetical protein U1R68_13385 [Pectobacterium colocasium]|uniref:hypothetical protein n=1 Tax=Pectobacterium colocasium TaxID=2878098 RepID=UPI001CD66490|nr:hypothetical protein [Pectobacterium colocasium]
MKIDYTKIMAPAVVAGQLIRWVYVNGDRNRGRKNRRALDWSNCVSAQSLKRMIDK